MSPIKIDKIVNVTITKTTKAVKQKGFGIPLILGPNASFQEKVRTYASLESVAEDFQTIDPEFLAAQSVLSQTINVENLKIAKEAAKVAQETVLNFDKDFVTLNEINYKINGVAQSTVPFDTSHSITLDNLALAIMAHPIIGDAQVTGQHEITITAQTPGIPFVLSEVEVTLGDTQPVASIETTIKNHGLVEDLIDTIQIDDDWYALVLCSANQDEIELVSAYIETQKKIFMTRTDDVNVFDEQSTEDIAATLHTNKYERTAVWWNGNNNDFIDAAILGRCLPLLPGSVTFAHKELAGISTDNLSETQINGANEKNANVYVEAGGVGVTLWGSMASGEYIDIIRDIDWLEARIKEEVFSKLVNLDKVPYTDQGVAIIENVIRGVLREAQNAGAISNDPDFKISVPKVSEVSFADKAKRHLPDVNFEATLASAVHKVTIKGKVSL